MHLRIASLALTALMAAGLGLTAQSDHEEFRVTGRAVCLKNGSPGPVADCGFGDPFGIEAEDGALHRLDPTDLRVEILTDERVNQHLLEVDLFVEDGIGKILHLHTIQDGEVVEPYYFCFTCNITSHIPGPCWCCQEEFEFKERPARTPHGH